MYTAAQELISCNSLFALDLHLLQEVNPKVYQTNLITGTELSIHIGCKREKIPVPLFMPLVPSME